MTPDPTIAMISAVVSAWAETEVLVRRVNLFGSRARGDHRSDSDIDLAILNNIDPDELATCIRSALPRDQVDAATLGASARDWTYDDNEERWQMALATLFDRPVHIERPQLKDRVVWPSLKRCRVLLYRRDSGQAALGLEPALA